MSDTDKRKGWFGSTFTKLKSALSKTKTAIVGDNPDDDSILENRQISEPDDEVASAPVNDLEDKVETEQKKTFHPPPEHSRGEQEKSFKNNQQFVDRALNIEESLGEVIPTVEAEPKVEASSEEQLQTSVEAKPDDTTADDGVKAFEPKSGKSFSKALTAQAVQSAKVHVDEDYLEGLEERLIKADIGLANAETLIENLRASAKDKNWTQDEVVEFLKREFLEILKSAPSSQLDFNPSKLNIYFVVGVNGTGKTTSIGKLCWRLKQEGKKVLMAAGDTFRAAAESQLEIWSKRAQVDIVRLEDGADPGAVVYTALDKARNDQYDCLVIDTAGRLHNKANLMAELKKVRNVIDKHGKDCNLESLLVVDASTGQNGLQQARVFTEVCSLTGVVLTKLDGTAKGGIVFSIARDLGIPVKLIGLGEQIDDLKDFEPEMFVEALL